MYTPQILTIFVSIDRKRIKEFVYAISVATYFHTEPTVPVKVLISYVHS